LLLFNFKDIIKINFNTSLLPVHAARAIEAAEDMKKFLL
jgi:hypothetical protein